MRAGEPSSRPGSCIAAAVLKHHQTVKSEELVGYNHLRQVMSIPGRGLFLKTKLPELFRLSKELSTFPITIIFVGLCDVFYVFLKIFLSKTNISYTTNPKGNWIQSRSFEIC